MAAVSDKPSEENVALSQSAQESSGLPSTSATVNASRLENEDFHHDETEEMDESVPEYDISVDGARKLRRQRAKKTVEADLELLRATVPLMPSKAPSRRKTLIWEKVAQRIKGVKRSHKYCADRVRELVKQHRADKIARPPSGDGRKPALTEEHILLDSIVAAEDHCAALTSAKDDGES